MKDEINSAITFLKNSPLLRILFIGFLTILLQIPISTIDNVISERNSRQQEVIYDITSKWGEQQTIVGPSIVVPYLVEISETGKEGEITVRKETRFAHFLPETLNISGKVDCETRYRGIYKVPVYRLALVLNGTFSHPDLSPWEIAPDTILWDRAVLRVRISDVHALTDSATIEWNGKKIGFLPGLGESGEAETGIHANLKGLLSSGSYPFSTQLSLNGSQGLYFAPFGNETKVVVESNWTAPSFQGRWLPTERTSEGEGFQATWNIPFLGRNYAQEWKTESGMENAVSSSTFGVNFFSPIDQYTMARRSIKYEMLFLVLTFATLWLFELLAKIRIHSIQYILVGVGMCLFYLLELSLAEHIGFLSAYICASIAVILLISMYCLAILKGTKRAAIVGTVITLLYGYLYVLLMNQDYALSIGSIGLFITLALVMYLTRKIDWYSFRE